MLRLTHLILVLFLVSIFLSQALADEPGVYFEFLNSKYNQHDTKLYDFLKTEFKSFIGQYPDSKNLPDASFLLGKVYQEDGDPHIALAIFLKTLFVYPNSERHSTAIEEINLIVANDRNYEEKQEAIKARINEPFENLDLPERHYRYLEFLYSLEQPKLYTWALNQYYQFLSMFPQHEQIDRVHRWIAGTYAAMGNHEAAVSAYLKYESLYPRSG